MRGGFDAVDLELLYGNGGSRAWSMSRRRTKDKGSLSRCLSLESQR